MIRFFIKRSVLGIIPALLLVSGCKKYLSPEPVSTFDPDYVFGSVMNAKAAVMGGYQMLAGDATYGVRISLYFPYDNDEMMGPNNAGDNDRRDIAHYNVTPGNLQLANPFNQLYAGIERVNNCIYYIPRMALYTNGSDVERGQLKRLHGESLTLRAQFYFELIRNWGDVPVQWEPSAMIEDHFQTRTDRDQIYDRLLADLLEAESLVPWRTDVGQVGDGADERITKGAVKALRARIALFRGGYSLRSSGSVQRGANHTQYYQIAYDECRDLMQNRAQHSLNPSYKSVFKDYICSRISVDPFGEIMFQVAMGGAMGSTDSKIGFYNGNKFAGTGNASLRILPSYFYLFDSTDTRRDVTAAPYETNADMKTRKGMNSNVIYDGKFRRDWHLNPGSTSQYLGINWPLIRFSDVLLMFAEADNELHGGPSGEAIAALLEVSRRGHGQSGEGENVPGDYDGFFKAIVKERSLEFGGEAIRKYDLIRWNLLGTALSEARANLNRLADGTAIRQTSYMAAPPAYVLSGNIAQTMYYYKDATGDDARIWANSFFQGAPSSTPAGTASTKWTNTSNITNSLVQWLGMGFKANHSELFPIPQTAIDANPRLSQNPGY